MKRSSNDRSDGVDEDDLDASMFLVHQNRALTQEMKRYKRQITEARKELELMRNKSREMESLVSVIQRAWSQLDIDASLLLDGLGDSEMVIQDNENFKLLHLFLNAGLKLRKEDSTQIGSVIPKLEVDEWSNEAEMETEKQRAREILSKQIADQKGKYEIDQEGNSMDEDEEDLGSRLEDHLLSHASFTLALLERLCIFISEAGIFERAPEIIHALQQAKELHAYRFSLQDKIEKLLSEIIDLETNLHLSKQQKLRAERTVDRLQEELATLRASGGSGLAGGEKSLNSHPSVVGADGHVSELEIELKAKVTLLETQLAESETAKSKVEMTLTERLARPLTQTEAQIADMRKSMEELRQQCKQRVSSLISEGSELQEKVTNLELAMLQLENSCADKCGELVVATRKQLEDMRRDRDHKQSDLLSAQAELSLTSQLKVQVEEYQSLELSRKAEIGRLQDKVRNLSSNVDKLHSHLQISRENETNLERILHEANVIHNDWAPLSVSVTVASMKGDDVEESVPMNISDPEKPTVQQLLKVEMMDGIINDVAESKECDPSSLMNDKQPKVINVKDEFSELVLLQAQGRARDLQQEMEDVRANMDDLILEIEAVSSEEKNVEEQCTRLLSQMSDSQSMQRGVLEENLRLHDQVAEIQIRLTEAQAKYEAVDCVISQQDIVIGHLRQVEQGLRGDISNIKKSNLETTGKRHVDEQELLEAQQKLSLTSSTLEATKKRNMELQARCDELGKKLEAERKLRMEAQRDNKAKKKEKLSDEVITSASAASIANGNGMSNEDVEMLEITLGMLRCSVCRDRFKEVAITRCFHLFCRHCIDENIRNRHRKCPACGEKFGQDDVKTIYFTH